MRPLDERISIQSSDAISLPPLDYQTFLHHTLGVMGYGTKGVGVLFTNNEEISEYNSHYRGKDGPTDVLSFPDDDDYYLGDIIISYEWVANRYTTKEIEKQLHLLLIHALLHLTGTHHDYTDTSLQENWKTMDTIYTEVIKKNHES